VDGIIFDSAAEAKHYYHVLKPRVAAKEITNLKLQPEFKCEIRGKKICKYKADFSYFDKKKLGPDGQRGCQVVEDVKGFKTDIYRLKKKLVEALFPGTLILEISAKEYRAAKYSLPSQSEVK
tara:strand:+ start:565 stop:930 length:366 start_codon:yes stop_codon:yes gene_type:complete